MRMCVYHHFEEQTELSLQLDYKLATSIPEVNNYCNEMISGLIRQVIFGRKEAIAPLRSIISDLHGRQQNKWHVATHAPV